MDFEKIFQSRLNGERILITENVTVNIDTFVRFFSSVDEPSYEKFVKVDAGRLGYKDFFDECKDEGMLN